MDQNDLVGYPSFCLLFTVSARTGAREQAGTHRHEQRLTCSFHITRQTALIHLKRKVRVRKVSKVIGLQLDVYWG